MEYGQKVWVCVDGELFEAKVSNIYDEDNRVHIDWWYRKGKLGTLLKPILTEVFDLETKQMVRGFRRRRSPKVCYFMEKINPPRITQKVRIHYKNEALEGTIQSFSEMGERMIVAINDANCIEVPRQIVSWILES
ncbi:MAG: hypothetical protein F6K14_08450 [Symploca sp. SIO2C1]|nr:hypothetical protein [Symploca sp. SIO2C1]